MAGEINWGLLDTRAPERAANAFYEGQQQQQKNALMAAQMQGVQRQNKLADLAMRDDEATRSAYQSSGGDMSKALAALQQGGQYKAAGELQTRMSAQQKEALAVKKAELENHLKTFETVGQIMSGVRDQASYDAARQQMAQIIGPEAAAKASPIYDPAFIEQQRTKAMSVKDQLANQWKAIGAQLDQDKFAETKTNNLRVDARTVRGQNLTNDRGIEANRLKGQENSINQQGIVGKKVQDVELKLQDDYRQESKGFSETSTAMKKILGAIDTADKNPGSALAAGTSFMKLLDPNSVVRESELGMALNASGWFDRATNIAATLQNGKIMTAKQKENLKAASKDLFEEAKDAQKEIDLAYRKRATDYGANPDRVIVDRGQNIPRPAGGAPAKVTNDAEYSALPPGATFVGPDGKTRRKP